MHTSVINVRRAEGLIFNSNDTTSPEVHDKTKTFRKYAAGDIKQADRYKTNRTDTKHPTLVLSMRY